jgi:hypothetical protein
VPMTARTFVPADPDPVALATVPEVQAALDDLLAANVRWETARATYATTRAAAEKAPDEDAAATMIAVSEGRKLPAITADKAQAAADEAQRVLDAAAQLAVCAEHELLEVIDQHRDALKTAQEKRLDKALDTVTIALDALEAAMKDAGMEMARYINVGNSEFGNPLSTSVPMRWEMYDSRIDANVDAYGGLDAIRQFAHMSRPATIRDKQLTAITEWESTIAGENPRYAQHRAPDGTKTWVRT